MTINLNRREMDRAHIEAFRVFMVGNDLPEALDCFSLEIGPDGQPVNLEAFDDGGNPLDVVTLSSLTATCQIYGYTPVYMTSLEQWDEFFAANRDAVLEACGSEADAVVKASQGGIVLGGGAAPEFRIRFVDGE